MTWLAVLFAFKIAVTALVVVGPLLLLPRPALCARLEIPGDAAGLARLYGVALLALLVGYAGGLHASLHGTYPAGVVAMGIVSNAGATLALIATGMARRHAGLTAIFAFIAVALVAAALFPATAMRAVA
jgi:hypothetical protein